MNDLKKYFDANKGNLIDKWDHYFDVYDRYFSRYRGTDVHLVEFGVWHGGSLQMWKDYFGPKAKIFGVDINPACQELEEDQVKIFIGDQADRDFLKRIGREVPRIDILLDDGGHTMEQQIATFEELYHKIEPNGLYVCEDLHTSYWKRWGGGYRKKDSFIEYSKNFVDYINAWHSEEAEKFKVNDFTKTSYGLHFYDSMLIVERKPMEKPWHSQTGKARVPFFKPPKKKKPTLLKRIVGKGK